MLRHDLSDWVGVNAPLLKDYQGEDISMGIWLAARFPNIIRNDRFHSKISAGEDCDREVATAPEQSYKSLVSVYARRMACGNECSECDTAPIVAKDLFKKLNADELIEKYDPS